jgi:hypothetical protein
MDGSGQVSEFSFDGKLSKEFRAWEKRGAITPGPSNRSPQRNNDLRRYLLSEEYPRDTSIPASQRGKPALSCAFRDFPGGGAVVPTAKVRAELEPIAGEPCHVLECTREFGTVTITDRVWLAHEKGMLPMKYEHLVNGDMVKFVEVEQIAKAAGETGDVWYPAKARLTSGMKQMGYTSYELTTHKFVPNITPDDSRFTIHFPDGTSVYDQLLEVVWTAGQTDAAKLYVVKRGNDPDAAVQASGGGEAAQASHAPAPLPAMAPAAAPAPPVAGTPPAPSRRRTVWAIAASASAAGLVWATVWWTMRYGPRRRSSEPTE